MEAYKSKAMYLRGMADGLGITEDTREGKLLLHMLTLLDEMCQGLDQLGEQQEEMKALIEVLHLDLESVENIVYDEEQPEEEQADSDENVDEPSEEEAEEAETEEEPVEMRYGKFLEYECPHCHSCLYYDAESIDVENSACPACGEDLFELQQSEEEPAEEVAEETEEPSEQLQLEVVEVEDEE